MELRATDDRLCEACFLKNEEDLAAIRRRTGGSVTSAAAAPRRNGMTSPAVTTKHVANADQLSVMSTSSPKPHNANTARATISASAQSNQMMDAEVVNENDQSATSRKQPAEVKSATATTTAPADDEISQLRRLVHQQQSTIKLLIEQLNIVMSTLGLDQSALQLAQQPTDDCNDHSNIVGNGDHGVECGAFDPSAPASTAEKNEETQITTLDSSCQKANEAAAAPTTYKFSTITGCRCI